MIAPASVTLAMVRIWPRCRGVSRSIRTNLRRSFSITSAARARSDVVSPVAISDIDLTEQGATIIPSQWNDPDATLAPILVFECSSLAKPRKSEMFNPHSCVIVCTAGFETTRCVSTSAAFRVSSSRTP